MRIRFENGSIASASGVLAGADLIVEDGTVRAVEAPATAAADEEFDLGGGWLLPGFIDTQVNGGGGVLFNDGLDPEAIRVIGQAHARFGTTAFLPTLISDTPAQMAAALEAVDAAIEAGVPGVIGTHVEGPFISEAKRGIHEAAHVRSLDAEALDLLCAPRKGRVMVTLAPERCAPGDIRRLASHGVVVSAGHTDGTYEQLTAAIAAGVTGFTHLFNAMSPFAHRAPGAVGAALDAETVTCGLIVDHVHLHDAAVRIAIANKGTGRIMLVTDAMPCVGTDDPFFMLQGKRIEVRGDICVHEDGTLAGTALDMAAAVRNTVAITGLPVEEVAHMASGTPARFLGLEASHGAIAPGMRADWAALDAALMPAATWIGGERLEPPAEDEALLCRA